MKYRVMTGHDVPLVDLQPLVAQGRSDGVRATSRTYGADGSLYEEGLYVELEFSVLADAAEYLALLTQFGLDAALTQPVTLLAFDPFFRPARYNGTAVRPEIGPEGSWRNYFLRAVTILVRDLEPLEEV